MKKFLGALYIAGQFSAGVAFAQVSEEETEAVAKPIAPASAQSWMNQRGEQRDTQLHWMAFKGDAASVERLIQGGADVNKAVDNGNRPLHLAAYKGHTEVVRVLLEHGADPGAVNDVGLTALDWARRKGHRDVELLLTQGANDVGPPPSETAAIENQADAGGERDAAQASTSQGSVSGGNYRVQLGSFSSRQAALDTWEQCRRRYAGLLDNVEMQVETVDLRGRVYHRLRAGGLSVDDARSVCAELDRSGQPCIVVGPPR